MKKLLLVVAVLLVIAVPARASAITITLDFSGTVNLSGVGGAASNTFTGAVTWDPAAAPIFTSPDGFSQYAALTGSFTFNSTNFSPFISQSNIFVGNDCIPCGNKDFFDVGYNFFSGSATVANTIPATNLGIFAGDLSGPTSMYSSTALPGNLDFLGSVTSSFSRLDTKKGDNPIVQTFGSFTATPPTASVPEPSSLLLLAFGLAALAGWRSRTKI